MIKKLKHLELIENVINRLAKNSFFLKGWTVIFVTALLGFAAKESEPFYVLLAAIPTLFFWGLDGFYLRQEQLFRRLYDAVRETDEDDIDFSMDTAALQHKIGWFRSTFSKTLTPFYPAILLLTIVIFLWRFL
ncbi:MAG: hypothetical protein OXU27_13160 [Candidatus Poribacteria bacterium]|nr:hypothetical protein [Candidatus Poribacteria bacterium]